MFCQVLFHCLAGGTEVSAAAGDPSFFYDRATTRAQFAFAPKHAGEVYVTAPLTLCVDVVAVSRPTFFYREVHNEFDFSD